MKKNKLLQWLICILPLLTSVIVLQPMRNMPDFLRGALTGVCIGLSLLCILWKNKVRLRDYKNRC